MLLQRFFLLVTVLGNVSVVVSIFVVLAVVALVLNKKRVVVALGGALAMGALAAYGIKAITSIARPSDNPLLYVYGSSFPSAHALMSMIVYGFIGFFLWHYVGTRTSKIYAVLVGLGIPFLVGISRVYLGVHWPSDVIFGWIFGLLILLGWFVHLIHTDPKVVGRKKVSAVSQIFIFSLICGEILFISLILSLSDPRIWALVYNYH